MGHVLFEVLEGKIISKIEIDKEKNEIIFLCSDGDKYKLYHEQD